MDISYFKILLKFAFGGGMTGVVDYLLSQLSKALGSLTDLTKEKVYGILNFSKKVLSVLKVLQMFIPVKWQLAYSLTVESIEEIVNSLGDLEVTRDEFDKIVAKMNDTVKAWNSEDDETCVTPAEITAEPVVEIENS